MYRGYKGYIAIFTAEEAGNEYKKYPKNFVGMEIKIGNSVISFVAKREISSKSDYYSSYHSYYNAITSKVVYVEKLPKKEINFKIAIKCARGEPVPLIPDYVYEFTLPNQELLKQFLMGLYKNFSDESFSKNAEKFVARI
jgi:hypothetical protein